MPSSTWRNSEAKQHLCMATITGAVPDSIQQNKSTQCDLSTGSFNFYTSRSTRRICMKSSTMRK
eukprot:3074697-Ditylum_brightwellii.AAC.1